MIWCGGDAQKDDPKYLIIYNLRISIKEQSFVLENMELYKLLSLLTTSTVSRGIHVFNYFSKAEYEEWFSYTLNKAIETARGWTISKDTYTSTIGTLSQICGDCKDDIHTLRRKQRSQPNCEGTC